MGTAELTPQEIRRRFDDMAAEVNTLKGETYGWKEPYPRAGILGRLEAIEKGLGELKLFVEGMSDSKKTWLSLIAAGTGLLSLLATITTGGVSIFMLARALSGIP